MKRIYLLTLIFIIFLTSCGIKQNEQEYVFETLAEDIDPYIETKEEIEIQEEIIPEINEVSFIAVGDNLIHTPVIKAGKTKDDNYDFNYMYTEISDYISNVDLKAINQETIFINDNNKYSGYPTFGSPTEIGDAIYNAGFNIITHATNHTYDKNKQGIYDTLEFWNTKNDVSVLGIHDSQEDSEQICFKTVNNISFAFLNYTYGLNGFVMPKDEEYLVDTFMNDNEKNIMLNQISYAKEHADFVIVFIHWGTEYILNETSYQINLANEIAESGADVIIGTHPHVLEPLKCITTSDNRNVPVYYSLGNFISNQNDLNTMLCGMAEIKFIKNDNNCYIEYSKLTPLVTHVEKDKSQYKVYLLDNYNEDINKNHKLYNKGLTISYLNDLFEKITNNE